MGQARGRACAPAHWLVLAPDPVSGPRVPGRCHHPSSQPPLPSAPLTSLLRVPSPRQRLTLGAGTGRARTRRSSGGGRRAGLGLHAPHLCRRARGSRHGAGAAREERRPPLPIRNTAADERRATPGRPAAATAASPRRRHLSPAARAARPELGAPGSAPRAAAPPQSPRCPQPPVSASRPGDSSGAAGLDGAQGPDAQPGGGGGALLPAGGRAGAPGGAASSSSPAWNPGGRAQARGSRTPPSRSPRPRPPCHAAQSGNGSPGTGAVAWGPGADAGKHAR